MKLFSFVILTTLAHPALLEKPSYYPAWPELRKNDTEFWKCPEDCPPDPFSFSKFKRPPPVYFPSMFNDPDRIWVTLPPVVKPANPPPNYSKVYRGGLQVAKNRTGYYTGTFERYICTKHIIPEGYMCPECEQFSSDPHRQIKSCFWAQLYNDVHYSNQTEVRNKCESMARNDLPEDKLSSTNAQDVKAYRHIYESECKEFFESDIFELPICNNLAKFKEHLRVVKCYFAKKHVTSFCKAVKYGPKGSGDISKYYGEMHDQYLKLTNQITKDRQLTMECFIDHQLDRDAKCEGITWGRTEPNTAREWARAEMLDKLIKAQNKRKPKKGRIIRF